MSKIRIKNFGPIKEGYRENEGWIDLKKVTVFIGNQGSGKSTVAKTISTLKWMEKSLNREDNHPPQSLYDFEKYFKNHGLAGYFRKNTCIEYSGDAMYIGYNTEEKPYTVCEKMNATNYIVPKIMYVPSERNFLSVVKDAFGVKGLSEPLFEFAEELRKSQEAVGSYGISLPINNVSYKYDALSQTGFIYNDEYSINLLDASSGFQSLVPLYLVSKNISELISNANNDLNADAVSVNQKLRVNSQIAATMLAKNMSNDDRLKIVEEIKAKFISKCFVNIVEEPELNLFPKSQRQILNSLLEFKNQNERNELILTTHSPYLINYLTLSVKAYKVFKELIENKFKLGDAQMGYVDEIVPMLSILDPHELSIFELNEKDGSIIKLKEYNGLPSDENYLNESLEESNELFAQLLEIQQNL